MENQDHKMATIIVKHMLSHSRLSLDVIKSELQLDDLAVRKAFIRLFFQGKVFGSIQEIESHHYLVFLTDSEVSLGIEEVLDWNVKEFDLPALQRAAQGELSDLSLESSDESTLQHDLEISHTRESSKKDNVAIEFRFGISGFKITARVKISNESDLPITNGKVRINFSPELHALDVWPDTTFNIEDSRVVAEFDSIEAQGTKLIVFNFQQIGIGTVQVDGVIQYKSGDGFARLIRLDQINFDMNLVKFRAAMLEPAQIGSFMKNQVNLKKIVAFGLPPALPIGQAQIEMELIARSWGLFQISKIQKPNLYMTFFFGSGLPPRGDPFEILLVPQIKGNIMSFYGCCKNYVVLSNLLRHVSLGLQERLISSRLISKMDGLINLNCNVCGAPFEKFPAKGEKIDCPKCKTSGQPW